MVLLHRIFSCCCSATENNGFFIFRECGTMNRWLRAGLWIWVGKTCSFVVFLCSLKHHGRRLVKYMWNIRCNIIYFSLTKSHNIVSKLWDIFEMNCSSIIWYSILYSLYYFNNVPIQSGVERVEHLCNIFFVRQKTCPRINISYFMHVFCAKS